MVSFSPAHRWRTGLRSYGYDPEPPPRSGEKYTDILPDIHTLTNHWAGWQDHRLKPQKITHQRVSLKGKLVCINCCEE